MTSINLDGVTKAARNLGRVEAFRDANKKIIELAERELTPSLILMKLTDWMVSEMKETAK